MKVQLRVVTNITKLAFQDIPSKKDRKVYRGRKDHERKMNCGFPKNKILLPLLDTRLLGLKTGAVAVQNPIFLDTTTYLNHG